MTLALIGVISALIVIADRLTKNWVLSTFVDGEVTVENGIVSYSLTELKEIPVIDNILYFKFAPNTGMAFSMFDDGGLNVITVITIVLLIACGFYLFSGKLSSSFEQFSLGMIIAGGVGNLIDRISSGYVVDFIDVRCINFAIFNVADIAITCGAILLCIAVLADEKMKKDNSTVSEEAKTDE